MSFQTATPQAHLTVQTVRSWPSLLLLGVACALFVGVMLAIATPPAEPPAAVPLPSAPADASANLPLPPLGA
jgi:hypothetical protein